MSTALQIGIATDRDFDDLFAAFESTDMAKTVEVYRRYRSDQDSGKRTVLVARFDGRVIGYLTINWRPTYSTFVDRGIPEVQDFNVKPDFRRRGFGSQMMDRAEEIIAERHSACGIGVGLSAAYGSAQRMYAKRGYVPDGRGLTYKEQPVEERTHVRVDDDLVIYMTKDLSQTDSIGKAIKQQLRTRPAEFSAELARRQWDYGAEAFAELQASGNDYYRTEFFGPAHIELCGDVSGLAVLDVGCGAGYFSRELSARDAIVTGIDLSSEMVKIAKPLSDNDRIGYLQLDAADIAETFPPKSFDLATACVSLQDMHDPSAVLTAVYRILKPESRFVFCNTHPCTDTPHHKWVKDDAGRKSALEIGGYFDRGPIEFDWKSGRYKYDWTTTAIHAPLSDWISWIIDAGFKIERIEEPVPTLEAVSRAPELDDALIVPYFLIFDGPEFNKEVQHLG